MNQFIIKSLKFIIIPIVVILIFDIWLRNQNTLYKEKIKGLIEVKDSIQILVLGNSHATYGIDPEQFSTFTYNLAEPAQTIYFDKRLTLSHLNELPNLKYVILSVDYHSLHTSSQSYRNIWSYYGNGIKYKNENYFLANISPFLFGYTKKVSFSFLKKRLNNSFSHKNTNTTKLIDIELFRINPFDKIKNGYLGANGVVEERFNTEWYKSRIKEFDLVDVGTRKEVINDLDDFINQLINNGIIPILVSSPTYEEYNNYLNPDIIKNNIEAINELSDKYNLEYWDYSHSNIFTKTDFNDPDHLNKDGAKKFSILLNEELMNYSNSKNIISINSLKIQN